jgi:hypothetical protein
MRICRIFFHPVGYRHHTVSFCGRRFYGEPLLRATYDSHSVTCLRCLANRGTLCNAAASPVPHQGQQPKAGRLAVNA